MDRFLRGMRLAASLLLVAMVILIFSACGGAYAKRGGYPSAGLPPRPTGGIIIDHHCTKLDRIPEQWIHAAKAELHIAYGHTSHGSQLVTGMEGLVRYKGPTYAFNKGGEGGALDLRDTPFSEAYMDLGYPDRTKWAKDTRIYLDAHPEVNVVIWSWCGQVDASEAEIDLYLNLMNDLEREYPKVHFVYMTGHLDDSGPHGRVHLRNEQIRAYCRANNKILYDFADIETWNPDGVYFGDKYPNDNCDYSVRGDGKWDGNWAVEWQKARVEGIDWYNCESAHSQPLNANLKAYTAWWLWARLAGWDGR
ncbi:MAG TPA: hypothetical protein P5244_10010 [Syntrophales bacterium]|nr:hypothetical protein [Syntrophales bacterium]